MSASDKKKLRKELNSAAMTERQIEEQKKQKKQKAYTLTFVIAMVLVVALVLCSVLTTPVTRLIIKNTTAVSVGDHKLSATELNYYYVDAISSLYSQYSSYGDYQYLYCYMSTGWNPSASLDSQTYNAETGETWADYFADAAIENAKWTYTMYDAAMAAGGYDLTEDDQKSIDTMISYMELYASLYGYSDSNGYVRAMYGVSADLESYEDYYTVSYIASKYANDHYDSLTYTDEDYREYEADKMNEFNSYSWLSYYVKASDYLLGGTTTTDENGKESTTYSDEEKQASVNSAKADADALMNAEISGLESFNTAINALSINTDAETEKSATEYAKYLYSKATSYLPNEEAQEWLFSADRAEGDMICVEYTTTADDVETVNGYYVLYYVGSTDNAAVNVGNVRHLLVAFEEDEDGNVTDEAKADAKKEAEELLAEYKAGEMTEEAFTALIKEHSDDTADGLYENITPDSNYVTTFKEWAIADHEVGDVEIVETEYGYHIMYYVGASDLNYRDYMIDNAITAEDYTAWEEEMVKDVPSEELNLKYLDRDLIMAS